MKLFRPFGSSEIDFDNQETPFRGILDKTPLRAILGQLEKEKETFKIKKLDADLEQKEKNKFQIACWISVIDKIYKKPKHELLKENNRSDDKNGLIAKRDALGKACLEILKKKMNLSTEQENIFLAKIHPYLPSFDKASQFYIEETKIEKYKGRWHDTFVKQNDTAKKIAEKIEKHLYSQALNRKEKAYPTKEGNKSKGLVDHKISAAEKSVHPKEIKNCEANLSLISENYNPVIEAIYKEYQKQYDAYKPYETLLKKLKDAEDANNSDEVKKTVEEKQKYQKSSKPTNAYGSLDIAMQKLYEHWGQEDIIGKNISHEEARNNNSSSEFYHLHMAIKEYYKKVIKRGDNRLCNLVKRLPKNANEMQTKLGHLRANADVNFYIRQGKILHYTCGRDWSVSNVALKNQYEQSRFHTALGQHEIKQNEAFIKIWLTAITSAARTLQNLVDPKNSLRELLKPNEEGVIEDDLLIIGGKKNEKFQYFIDNHQPNGEFIFENVIDYEHIKNQFKFLFGKHAEFYNSKECLKEIIKLSLKLIPELRNNSFHFKGFDKFKPILISKYLDGKKERNLSGTQSNQFVSDLYKKDQNEIFKNLHKKFETVQFNHFLKEEDFKKIHTEFDFTQTPLLPLPKFSKLLQRAENNKNEIIPAPSARVLEQNEYLRLQYTVLKEIYDKPFKAWLETADIKTVAKEIAEETTANAKDMNKSKTPDALLNAKIANALKNYFEGNNQRTTQSEISDLFYFLTAETAKEAGVQKGYESDKDNAKSQASYIENFKCDLVGQMFKKYITDKSLDFLLADTKADTKEKRDSAYFYFDQVKLDTKPNNQSKPEQWQANLYFILHLIPVEEVNQLLHQLKKWLVVTEKTGRGETERTIAQNVANVLGLYADMHDAKFIDNAHIDHKDAEIFKNCYRDIETFNQIFQVNGTSKKDKLIPIRGLREVMRYGDMNVPFIKTLFKDSVKVDWDEWQELDIEVAKAQTKKKELHEEWVEKKKLSETDNKKYNEAVKTISEHTHLKKQLYLIDHKNLHRLLMQVLGRLVGFAHHFERDWYFITLAVCYEKYMEEDKTENPLLTYLGKKGLKKLQDGQINAVFSDENVEIKTKVSKLIPFENVKNIRNDLAHFNMLKNEQYKNSFSITDWIDKTRDLMAYDRKMKNAVAKSIKELLEQENILVEWTCGANHQLSKPTKVNAKIIKHLGANDITELAHSNDFIKMVKGIL